MMKVKVKKCHGGEWYNNHLGEEFEIININEGKSFGKLYVDITNRRVLNSYGRRIMAIWKSDVEII